MSAKRAWTTCVAIALGGAASGICSAQAPADALAECMSLKDEKARLRCYDEQMARAKEGAATADTSEPAASTAKPTPPTPAPEPARSAPQDPHAPGAAQPSESFGLDAEALRRKRAAEKPDSPLEPEALVARVKSVSKRAYGEYQIVLDNGQVWVETLRTGGLAPREGETVTVKRGALGSYYLTPQSGLALRVRRIK